FFGFLRLGGPPPIPGGKTADSGLDALAVAGMLGAPTDMHASIALGGSLEGNMLMLSAVPMGGGKATGGILSSIFSSARAAEPMAASFAPRNADVFIDVALDWQKLYEGLAPLFAQFAGAATSNRGNAGAAGRGSSLEAQLGFSIKNDLLPAIGNELAICIS